MKKLNDKQFLELVELLYKQNLDTLVKKNFDYSATDGEPFKNFVKSAEIAGITPEQGLLVRMGDKLHRAGTVINNRIEQVTDESAEDTLLDLANYAMILVVMMRDNRK